MKEKQRDFPVENCLAIVNPSGRECPYSLQLIVCLLLYEITSFVRETFQTLPRITSLSTTTANTRSTKTNISPPLLEVSSVVQPEIRPPNRLRMDSIISLISHRSVISSLSEHLSRMCSSPLFFKKTIEYHLASPKVSPNTTIIVNPAIHERHITFGMYKENDSSTSNHTTVLINENDEEPMIMSDNRVSGTY